MTSQLHKRTLQCSLLSLSGPGARAARGRRGRSATSAAREEHGHLAARIAGAPVRLIATALPSGVDVLLDAHAHDAVLRGARAGRRAAGVQRTWPRSCAWSAGARATGVDLDASVIPQEAGLNERAVSFTKGCYVGQETVARLHYKGKPNRHLRGLRLSEAVPAGHRAAPRRAPGRAADELRAITTYTVRSASPFCAARPARTRALRQGTAAPAQSWSSCRSAV